MLIKEQDVQVSDTTGDDQSFKSRKQKLLLIHCYFPAQLVKMHLPLLLKYPE